ncbi:MAG: response regulator [Deltaproteobacteria bacterium]|nr:response regulator [Deltaproteobacteria bacterium]
MIRKLTYQQLEQRVLELENEFSMRQKAEEKTRRLNSVLHTIHNINQRIFREKNRDRLLQDICKIAVNNRGYHNVWIALFDDTRKLVMTAEFGLGKIFTPMLKRLESGRLTACGQKALLQSDIVVIEDPPSTCDDCPLVDKYEDRGAMTKRLDYAGNIYGLISASIPKEFVVDLEEQRLFQAIAQDIAFALHSIEVEKGRMMAEKALRESESSFRALLYSQHDEIVIVDREYRITDANVNFIMNTSRKRQEVLGNYCYEISYDGDKPCDEQCDECDLREVFATGRTRSLQKQKTAKDGSRIWVDIHQSPLKNTDGDITHVIMSLRDVTQEIQLEKQLQQAQKMEAVGNLAAGIAHDFNNILGVVLLNSELALSDSTDDKNNQLYLERILKASHRAKDLVEQILIFSRQAKPERKSCRIIPVVQEALKLVRASLPSAIELTLHIQTECGPVLVDPIQIHQVILNLCNNAAHAMQKKGGMLEVSLEDVDLDVTASRIHTDLHPGPYLKLTVRDTGSGMNEHTLKQIFDPFFTTKNSGEGTGMGLAVVHGIVKNYDGAILVDSMPEKGTSIDIFLPRIEVEIEPVLKNDEMLTQGNEEILIVDNNEELAWSFKNTLENMGYKVTGKTTSTGALNSFCAEPDRFDAIITDLSMPGMTGTQLAAEILHIRPDIPIILCTGYNEEITPEKAKEIGFCQVLIKPVTMYQLVQGLRRVLDQYQGKNHHG